MKALIEYTEQENSEQETRLIDIDSLSDLLKLMKEEDCDIVIKRDSFHPKAKDADIIIEIYNDYRE